MRSDRWPLAAVRAAFVILILCWGRDSGPAVGPGGRGSTVPWVADCRDAHERVGQGGLARAVMRSHAVTMSAAQGQLAWIFSCRLRPPRVRRAAACRIL